MIPEVRSPGSLHLPLGGAGAQCLRGADGVHRSATAGSYEAVGRRERDDQQGAPGRDGWSIVDGELGTIKYHQL